MIETDRLILRPHTLDDYEPSHAMWSDPAVARFIGGKPASREETWHRLLRYAGHWRLFGHGLFALFEQAGGGFVGEAGFADFGRGLGDMFDPFPEAAWVLARAAHGKGYAEEAMRAVLDRFAHDRRTVCIISAENAPSVRLAGRLGYAPFGEAVYHGKTITMFARG